MLPAAMILNQTMIRWIESDVFKYVIPLRLVSNNMVI